MEVVYLGLFGKILNFVLNKIFQPVFSFLASLLNSLFTWLFQNVLMPILLPLLKDVFTWALDVVLKVLGSVFYFIFSTLLRIIDYMQMAFDVFIGLTNVTYTTGGKVVEGPLLEVLMQNEAISTAFWVLTLGGLGIAMMFTIFGTARSAFDLDFENKRPVSKVLSSMFKTFIRFFMVPFSVLFLLKLSLLILSTASSALTAGNSGGTPTLGSTLFVIASLDAAANKDLNVSTAPPEVAADLGINDSLRKDFYLGKKDYADIELVGRLFKYEKFDYLVGILVGAFLLIILAVCLIVFVQRIFEILLLYVASPYFVATIPLDDGEKFNQWREMMVAKCFSGFGSAIGMKIYLLVCPAIVSGQIALTAGSTSSILNSPEASYLIKLVFLLGGAWAVFKSGSMLTSILNYQAGMAEQTAGGMAAGLIYGHTVGSVMARIGRSGGSGGGEGDGGQDKEKKGKKEQAFTKPKPAPAWKPASRSQASGQSKTGIGSHRTPKPALSMGSHRAAPPKPERDTKLSMGSHRTPKPKPEPKMAMGSHRTPKPSVWAKAAPGKPGAALAGKKAVPGPQIRAAKTAPALSEKEARRAARQRGQFFGLDDFHLPSVGLAVNGQGKVRMSASLGKVFSNRYDENGNHKVRIMGMGFTRDKDGRCTSVKFPMVKAQRDSEGRMRPTRVSLGKMATFKTNTETGKLSFSDCSLLNVHIRPENKAEGVSRKVQVGGIRVTSSEAGGVQKVKLGGMKFDVGRIKGTNRKESGGK